MLLIITNQSDLASDYLILRLKELGLNFRRFNTEQLGVSVSVEVKVSESGSKFAIEFEGGNVITQESVSAVYFRQPLPPNYENKVVKDEVDFANDEALEFLRSLWRVIPEHLWLNHPKQLWIASNKVDQLTRAVQIGLKIPETLISTDITNIKNFLSRHKGKVIGKAVKHGFVTRNNDVLLAGTQQIPDSFLNDSGDFATIPMIYQQQIQKIRDLRVVVVGNQVFSTAIESDDSNNPIDWRITDLLGRPLRHTKISLSLDIEKKCKALVNSFGLLYSSIDMAQDVSGDIYFIELNPNGQWAWIEQLTEHPIRDAIIETLKVKVT